MIDYDVDTLGVALLHKGYSVNSPSSRRSTLRATR